ncbi:Inositol-pentakisphosphate 2-kinase [Sarcoptes scabiei]|uniref:Inositol-pentakisphosphate 2-kinase n=2 Tax=Sarcoptes scabiei TaxID=52283 RepID=A0A834RE57_SARSC|nr:Inositol-pentakisphosphate 2-kinase [Sarcoptes scabiei]
MFNSFEIDRFNLDDLIYLGEGNSSLVIGIKSTSQVIRLLKLDAKKLQNAKDILTHLSMHIDFNRNVVPCILPRNLFEIPKLICLKPWQLDIIKDKTLPDYGYALLMADHCSFSPRIHRRLHYDNFQCSVISIEIKPKQGFISSEELFDADDVLRIKSRICRFGLSQFYKLRKKSIKKLSSYCPLDLFSGCLSRALYSLVCLIENPQNNFRVFINSHLIYDDHSNFGFLWMILKDFFQVENDCNNRNVSNTKSLMQNIIPSSLDPINVFCRILLKALYKPLPNCPIKPLSQIDNITLNNLDENCNLDLKKLALKMSNKYIEDRYEPFRAFLELFETFPIDSDNFFEFSSSNHRNYNSINNRSNNHRHQSNEFFSMESLTEENGVDETIELSRVEIVETLMMMKTTAEDTSCIIHQKIPLNVSKQSYLKCVCKGLCSRRLSSRSLLHSILQAQKLDQLDSFKAIKLFELLSFRYDRFKKNLSIDRNNGDDRVVEESFNKFILQNFQELYQLWMFSLSLTAKDCSIMIALHRLDSDTKQLELFEIATSQPSSTSSSSTTMFDVFDEITEKYFLTKLAIIDLDFKPPIKIHRTLHNDRRMIDAFFDFLYRNHFSLPKNLSRIKLNHCDFERRSFSNQ